MKLEMMPAQSLIQRVLGQRAEFRVPVFPGRRRLQWKLYQLISRFTPNLQRFLSDFRNPEARAVC